MNDRSLRNIKTSIRKDEEVSTCFQITAASEVMAVFCLAKDINDLKVRINNMIIGYTKKDKAIFVKDLEIAGSVVALLKDAFKPNLVQTLENNPAIIHGGPFANIAHGCNSIVATDMASKLAEYVVTEAGFGADLGMEKFLNIKSVQGNFNPNVIVIVATIRGLKAQGSWSEGLELLEKHIENINNFNVNYVIALNSFDTDSKKELEQFKTWANDKNYPFAITNTWVLGSAGGKELAKAVISKCSNKKVVNTYSANDSITSKISKIAKSIYGASNVKYSAKVLEALKIIEKNKLNKLQICIAKTPTSITDNPLALGLPKIWTLTVTDISISNGAWFIVANCGDVMTMPGLSKNPNAKDISFDGKKITGLK